MTPSGGFAGAVILSVSGLPPGASPGLSQNNLSGTWASVLTVTVPAGAQAASWPITITGVSGGLTHTATTSLNLTGADFTIKAVPVSPSQSPPVVPAGSSATYTVAVNPINGYSGTVSLANWPPPAGVTVTLSSPTASPTQPATLTVSVSSWASLPSGQYAIPLVATDGHRFRIADADGCGMSTNNQFYSFVDPAGHLRPSDEATCAIEGGGDEPTVSGVDASGASQGVLLFSGYFDSYNVNELSIPSLSCTVMSNGEGLIGESLVYAQCGAIAPGTYEATLTACMADDYENDDPLCVDFGTEFTVAAPPPAVQVTPGPTMIVAWQSDGPSVVNPTTASGCTPITATGQPEGGLFAWSTSSQAVSLDNANTATVTVCSVSGAYSQAPGDVAVNVTYTVGGHRALPQRPP